MYMERDIDLTPSVNSPVLCDKKIHKKQEVYLYPNESVAIDPCRN